MRCHITLSASLLAGMEQQCSSNPLALALHVLADQTVPSGYAPLPTTIEQTQRMYVCQQLLSQFRELTVYVSYLYTACRCCRRSGSWPSWQCRSSRRCVQQRLRQQSSWRLRSRQRQHGSGRLLHRLLSSAASWRQQRRLLQVGRAVAIGSRFALLWVHTVQSGVAD
jgi:hypothetical protein